MATRTLTPREYDRHVRHDTPWRKARRTGYRQDVVRHQLARQKVTAKQRQAIARLGGLARAAALARTKKQHAKKAPG